MTAEVLTIMHLFHCPECRRPHEEPADARFVLSVVCVDCALDVELRLAAAVREARFERLAAA